MVFNGVKNYYEILDVSTDATTSEIKTAYRKLARIYHPDVNNDANAIDMFKEITSAYETLCNELERRKYDTIHCIFRNKSTNNSSNNTNTTNTNKQEQKTQQKNIKDTPKEKTNYKSNNHKEEEEEEEKTQEQKKSEIKKTVKKNLFDIIKSFITIKGRNRKSKEKSKPQKGENISTEVIITPDEVMTGSKRVINIRTTKTCPKCFGHKFTNGDKCNACGGKGIITETKRITLTIPKGIKDGAKLRLKGEGATGKNGGKNGDVYVQIRIETKTKVHFDKLNIYYNVPITPFEAALGEEISIPAFDGTIKLKLPKNTCSGQKFRIAKQGLKKNGKIGDLIVTVSIEFSHNLSDDEIKLYEQLKNLSSDNVRENFGYGS